MAWERSATGTALAAAAEAFSAVRKLRAKRKESSVVVNSSTDEQGDQHAVCTRPANISYNVITDGETIGKGTKSSNN